MKDEESKFPSMPSGRVVLLLAAIGVCLGVSILWQGGRESLNKASGQQFKPEDVDFNGATASVGHSDKPVRIVTSDRPDIWKGGYALTETNFSEGKGELLARYGAESPQLASYTLEWSHACAESLSIDDAAGDGSIQAVAIMREFCAGSVPINDVDGAKIFKKTARTEFAMELSQIEMAHGVDSAIDFAEKYIRSAQDPYSVRVGLDYMARTGILFPPASERSVRSEQRLREVYGMARDSYVCDIYGGCSATSPVSARFCLEVKCSHLADYQRQVGSQLSRSDLSAFNWYLSAIRALRD